MSPLSYAQTPDWERDIRLKARKIDGDFYYVALQEIAESLNAHTYYSNKVRKAVLYLGETRVIVTAFNPFVLLESQVLQMPVATRYDDGDILVPVKFFVPILKRALHATERANDEVRSDLGAGVNILGVQVETKANGTLIRVKTREEFNESSISTRYSGNWLYVDILGGRIDPTSFATQIASDDVRDIVPVQLEEMVQLSFQLNRSVMEKSIHVSQQGNEILISIPSHEGLSADVLKKLHDVQAKWRIDRIIIDPGHGGRDPGTTGPRGTHEKDIVLAVAKKLKRLLERRLGVEVLMTRQTDKYVSLKERTQFANKNRGKIFISIHANWNRNRNVRGTTTYFLGLAKSEESLEIAQRENAVIKYDDGPSSYGQLTDEKIILATMAQNSYNKESQDFAAMIQGQISRKTGLQNRGVKQAGFYVMVGASMPNVLVETAFMSNKREEKLLNTASFQEKVARGIFESVKKFKEKYEEPIRRSH
ncbi:MAG: N-acetylmuramoyl-L-alanine amidase [bacterium]